jgi:Rieske Fe-S protein
MNEPNESQGPNDRRTFLASGTCMAGGLVASYGSLAIMAGRFLYPTEDDSVGWQFVAPVDELAAGEALEYVSPAGAKVVIARQSEGDSADSFMALSGICPHLGCQVHWEPHNDRFFCPCHNGVFDPQGRPTEGPPASANQQLTRFRLKVEDGLLYVLAPLWSIGREA